MNPDAEEMADRLIGYELAVTVRRLDGSLVGEVPTVYISSVDIFLDVGKLYLPKLVFEAISSDYIAREIQVCKHGQSLFTARFPQRLVKAGTVLTVHPVALLA